MCEVCVCVRYVCVCEVCLSYQCLFKRTFSVYLDMSFGYSCVHYISTL